MALPHVQLSQVFSPSRLPLLDPSVLGNFRATSTPKTSGVQVDRLHAQIATITLGTPPQTLTCLLDSGSSDLWVPSRRCRRCNNNLHFHADDSSTFKPDLISSQWGEKHPKVVRISYGSGTVVGYSARDTLKFGSLEIPDQAFIIVEDAALPPGRNWDGICGLGWRGIAHVGPTLYERIQEAGKSALFTIAPPTAASASPTFPWLFGGTSKQGHMLIGEVPKAAVGPEGMVWVPAERFDPSGGHLSGERSFWVVSGGVQIRRPQPVPVRFLVDTGTNQVLLVPQRHYQAFISSLIPANLFQTSCGQDPHAGVVCDCSVRQDPNLLPLQISLGGRSFALPLSEMFMEARSMSGGTLCLLTIQPNAMAPSESAGAGSTLGDLLGALFGGPRGHPTGLGGGPVPPPPPQQQVPQQQVPQQQVPQQQVPQQQAPQQAPQQEVLPPMPFQIPGFGGQQGGPVEVIEEVTEYVRSDGEVCRVTRIVKEGKVVQQSAPRCEARHRRLEDRRLQTFPWPFAAEGEGSAPAHDDELWMLGGVFLEHFVLAFDFDHGRLGLGEPAKARRRLAEESAGVPLYP